MADEPKLIVALEARLDKFEKQMREAGLIAEREMRSIETKMGTVAGGVAIGTVLAKAIEKGVQTAVDEIQKLIDKMLLLGTVTKSTGVDLEELQRIGFTTRVAGMDDKAMAAGLESASAKMNEMNHHTTRLSELLDANNIKYRDQAGQVLKVSDGLELAATLMGRAKTEADKIEIARIFGLTQQWVGVLGQGVEQFRQMKGEAPVQELAAAVAHMKVLEGLANRMKALFTGWGSELVVEVLPKLEAVARVMSALATGLAQIAAGGVMEDFATNLANKWAIVHGEIKSALVLLDKPRVTVNKPGAGVTFPERGGGGGQEVGSLERFDLQLSKHIELLKAEVETIGKSVGEQEKARQIALLTEAAKREGLTIEQALTAERQKQINQTGELKQGEDERRKLVAATKEFSQAFGRALEDAIIDAKEFSEVVKQLAKDIARMALRLAIIKPLESGLESALKGIVIPGRMAGGPVTGGSPYVVGEKGPELFVPRGGGMIVPNGASRGMGAGAIEQNVVINDYSGQAKVRQKQTPEGGGVEVFIPAIEQMLASGVARGRGSLSKSMDARRRGTNLYG